MLAARLYTCIQLHDSKDCADFIASTITDYRLYQIIYTFSWGPLFGINWSKYNAPFFLLLPFWLIRVDISSFVASVNKLYTNWCVNKPTKFCIINLNVSMHKPLLNIHLCILLLLLVYHHCATIVHTHQNTRCLTKKNSAIPCNLLKPLVHSTPLIRQYYIKTSWTFHSFANYVHDLSTCVQLTWDPSETNNTKVITYSLVSFHNPHFFSS